MNLHDVELPGLTPTPLGNYLAALGLLKAVGIAQPEARGWWSNAGTFWLRSRMEPAELVRWLVEEREPDVFVRPWNPDQTEDAQTLSELPSEWSRARRALEFSVQRIADSETLKAHKKRLVSRKKKLKDLGVPAREMGTDYEVQQLSREIERLDRIVGAGTLRSDAPEDLIPCFDCARVTGFDGATTVDAPLLGTGGNDGKRDFMLVYLRQLRAIVANREKSKVWLRYALGLPTAGVDSLPKQSGNSWFPDSIKIHNSGQEGFFTEQPASPWSYLLACEGIRLLAGGSSRRLGANMTASGTYPFIVMPPSYATKDTVKKSDAEFWAPLWSKPAKCSEVALLFRSGRAAVSGRAATKPHQIAEALLARGVDRGITAFQRFSLNHTTSANAYEAIPLELFRSRTYGETAARCLAELENWQWHLPQDSTKVVVGMKRAVEDAILSVCEAPRESEHWQQLLITCANVELRIARNKAFRDKSRPLQPLSAEWLRFAAAGAFDPEFVFAASIGSILGIRENIFGAKRVWSGLDLLQDLAEILRRRLLDSPITNKLALSAAYTCPPHVIAAFLDCRLDERRIQQLIPAFALLGWAPNWDAVDFGLPAARSSSNDECIPRPLAMMKTLFQPENFWLGRRRAFGDREFPPRCPEALASLLAGDAERAVEHVTRRLRACGVRPVLVPTVKQTHMQCQRWMAALLAPWSHESLKQGLRQVLEIEDGTGD